MATVRAAVAQDMLSNGGSNYEAASEATRIQYAEARCVRNRNGEANSAIGLGFFLFDGPIRRKRQSWVAEIFAEAIAVVRLDANRECFSRNDFAAIGNSIEAQPCDKD